MIGLLFASGLFLSAVIAWPIYLHFRKRRNRRIQTVPSLRLFGFTKQKTKRIRLRQLALLIMRVSFIAAIALLISQPYLKTSRLLTLPPVAGDHQPARVVSVIIDDSIASMHGRDGRYRLDESKEVIIDTLNSLDQDTQVRLCLTTSPYPTPLMTVAEARDAILRLKPIPAEGDCAAAIENSLEMHADNPVALIVSAPLSQSLWAGMEDMKLRKTPVPMMFHNTTEAACQAYFIGSSQAVISLGGKHEILQEERFRVVDGSGKVVVDRNLTAHESLLGEVIPDVTPASDGVYKATLGEGNHPWQTIFFQGVETEADDNAVVIIREDDRQSLWLDQLFTGIILSFHGDTAITHYDPKSNLPLPIASTVVIIGQPELGRTLRPWLDKQVETGVRLLSVPRDTSDPSYSSPDYLPAWGKPRETDAADFPVILERTGHLPIDELTVLEVRQIKPDNVLPPVFKTGGVNVMSTQNSPCLVRKQVNSKSVSWALGIPLNKSPDSVAWHPALPFLLDRLLFPAKSLGNARYHATVGEILRVDDWFGMSIGSATLTPPSGNAVDVQASSTGADTVTIEEAGVYTLSKDGTKSYRVANIRREEDSRVLDTKAFESELSGFQLQWMDKAGALPQEAFVQLSNHGQSVSSHRRRVDLSPLVFWAMAVFLLFESLLCYVSWRQRAVVAQ